jgi:hypothetical protein
MPYHLKGQQPHPEPRRRRHFLRDNAQGNTGSIVERELPRSTGTIFQRTYPNLPYDPLKVLKGNPSRSEEHRFLKELKNR